MSGLLVDISELAGHPGAVKEIFSSPNVPGLSGVLGHVEDDFVTLSLRAESVLEGIQVSGGVTGRMVLACSRCLRSFEQSFEHEVDETFFFEGGDEREGYQISGNKIDLEPMVRDVVVLGIPTIPLHRRDCKGLCPICGSDLNDKDCGHRPDLADSRWAPLRELGLKLQESSDADA